MSAYRHLFAAAAFTVGTALSGCVGLAVGAGATAGVAASEERGLEGALDDAKIRAEINHLWIQQDIEMYRQVTLTINEGRVMLTGTVPRPEARVDAVRLAWQASGVKEVINEIDVASGGGPIAYVTDSVIANKVRLRLLEDKLIKNINYTVEVNEGVVYLMGIAQNEAELERVIDHARAVSGVRRVVNHVRLRTDSRRVTG
ncbi:MAG: BON domain-containing protein [Magnetospirillum sp.]|nr:BON domain-containing protein [Magnetospirillum sp.]